jgi:hypothetical protein
LFWDFPGYGGQIAVRMGMWKGIRTNVTKDPEALLELYDLNKDLGERQNVVQDYPEVATRIESIMLEARARPEFEAFRFGRYSAQDA